MKKRKIIALIIDNITHEVQKSIIEGISVQAKALNYDIAVFTMPFNRGDHVTSFQYGEENIYNLINYDLIDGVIFAAGIIHNDDLFYKLSEKLADKLRNQNVPTVIMDFECEPFENVYIDDEPVFEKLVDHFIDKHNCRDIICLTGFKDNKQAEMRLQGYKNSLTKHGIPVKEENCIYGDFWKIAPGNLADEILSGKRHMPDAVVCASDLMAVELCNRLTDAGFNVPQDIRIAGFDAAQEALENVPSITTCHRDTFKLGMNCVLKMHEFISGEKAEPCISEEEMNSSIVTGQSCGCGRNIDAQIEERKEWLKNVREYEELYKVSNMLEVLLEANSLDDLIKRIDSFTYLIGNLKTYYICLCKGWDDFEKNEDEYIREGYAEEMVLKLKKTPDEEWVHTEDTVFKTADLLAEFTDESDTYYFTPIHFRDYCFGYSVVTYKDFKNTMTPLYNTICRNVNNSLEFVRVQSRLESINQRLVNTSIRDSLTGIYNRKGFDRFADEIFAKAVSEKRKLLIIAADLDMLKPINDNYGHIEGDSAITIAANALNTSCNNNEVCARTGGDEFLAIGCFDYTDEIINGYIKSFNEFFERYNSVSQKPYEVGASIGYVCVIPDENTKLQDIIDEADHKMYSNKVARKKNRR